MLALLLLDDGWRLRTVLVGGPAAKAGKGQASHRPVNFGRAGASAGGADSCGWLCSAVVVTHRLLEAAVWM